MRVTFPWFLFFLLLLLGGCITLNFYSVRMLTPEDLDESGLEKLLRGDELPETPIR
jgi:hypothetical protein